LSVWRETRPIDEDGLILSLGIEQGDKLPKIGVVLKIQIATLDKLANGWRVRALLSERDGALGERQRKDADEVLKLLRADLCGKLVRALVGCLVQAARGAKRHTQRHADRNCAKKESLCWPHQRNPEFTALSRECTLRWSKANAGASQGRTVVSKRPVVKTRCLSHTRFWSPRAEPRDDGVVFRRPNQRANSQS
jgi:hypothetical protein